MYKTETVILANSAICCLDFKFIRFWGWLCVFFFYSLWVMMSIFGESCGELTYVSTEGMNIDWGHVTGFILPVRFSQRALNGNRVNAVTAVAMSLLSTRNGNEYAGRATICKKCLDPHRTMPQEWYYKSRPLLNFCWTELKTMPGKPLKRWGFSYCK